MYLPAVIELAGASAVNTTAGSVVPLDVLNVVVDLTNAGLDYYFLRPLRQAKVGFVAQQTARLGMAGALRIMSPVIRTILANANATQVRVIARHVAHLM